jgi:organic radical activating enzyme
MDTLSVAQKLLSNETRRITITGGEPFQQADALKDLVFDLNAIAPVEIIVYTGYDWKELFERFPQALLFLREYDVILVTGRFVRELDNPFIQWRGSTNQVPIYLGAMASIWGEPYVLNWDTIEIDPANDNLYLPVGVAQLFSELFGSESDATRRCGQNKF